MAIQSNKALSQGQKFTPRQCRRHLYDPFNSRIL